MPEITKNQIKLVRSLQQKKNRKETGLFLVEGIKNVAELINSDYVIEYLFAVADWAGEFSAKINISAKILSQMSTLSSPDKVLAVARIKQTAISSKINQFTLVLDGINDPGNLGTIIRTADWFGIKTIVCSNETVDCYNPKVVQASKGSLFHINIFHTHLPTFLSTQNLPIYGASLAGNNIKNCNLQNPCFLVMGSESHGISNAVTNLLTTSVLIPKYGHAESLNVGIATGILLHEFTQL